MAAATPDKPTRWDLSPLFSALDGEDYRAAFAQLEAYTTSLEEFFDKHEIRRLDEAPAASDALAGVLAETLCHVNALVRLSDRLEGFLQALVTTDSYNDAAQRELSKLERLDTRRRKLGVRLDGWIGSLSPLLDRLKASRPELEEHAFFLADTARQSRFLMNEELEGLAAELCLDGGGAFGKLQGNVTSQLKVSFERDGRSELLPITVIRNLSFDRDAEIRRRAYEVEIEGWKSIRTTVAACLNGVKGTAQSLAHRRGRKSVLEAALDQNKIDRATLDALLGSIREAFPVFRRYLRSKAKKLGHEQLAWWDLFAPLGGAHMTFTWRQARGFIVDKFGRFSPQLAAFASTAFDERWIDGEPRDGKRGGAYCMGIMAIEQSRILANFDGSFEQVSTLAHELGHGFHNECQRGLEPLLRGAPMTLAETASIFCETLIAEAALEKASADERLTILEAQLSGATQVCLDISSRFLFESAVFERRETSELSADDFCTLMHSAQKETYGDAVDPKTYHPYMWLWKPHYYSYTQNFYNFPYAFGHLFALGLYAEFERQGEPFVSRYRELLRSTGQDYAAPLAARFGIDITRPDFWRRSLAIVEKQVRRFEAL
jgi:oligoendopeptidase F